MLLPVEGPIIEIYSLIFPRFKTCFTGSSPVCVTLAAWQYQVRFTWYTKNQQSISIPGIHTGIYLLFVVCRPLARGNARRPRARAPKFQMERGVTKQAMHRGFASSLLLAWSSLALLVLTAKKAPTGKRIRSMLLRYIIDRVYHKSCAWVCSICQSTDSDRWYEP